MKNKDCTVIYILFQNPAFIPDRDLDYKQRVYSFQAMGLRDDVVTALDSLGINQPTVIQVCILGLSVGTLT